MSFDTDVLDNLKQVHLVLQDAMKRFLRPMARPMVNNPRGEPGRSQATKQAARSERIPEPDELTPVERAFYDDLVALFDAWRDDYPGSDGDAALSALLTEHSLHYVDATSVLSGEQHDLLRQAVEIFLDEFVPTSTKTIQDTTARWHEAGFDDRAFSSSRAVVIVRTQTRWVRSGMQFISDVIARFG